jgi:hypothetical protein
MTSSSARQRVLIDAGLSNRQAQQLSQELAVRGIGVECTPSRLAGWDVWAFSSFHHSDLNTPADD